MMITKNDYSRCTHVYFLRTKSEVVNYLMWFLADVSPAAIEVVWSNGGTDFSKGALAAPCGNGGQGRNYL